MQIRNIERNHQLNVMILIWPSYRPLTSCTSSGAHRLPWINIMVQPKSICSCSNDLAVLVWAGHEARPSPRAEVHHSAILEGKTVPTADPVTNAIRINSSQQLVEKGRLNYVSSHRKALLSWPSASHPPVSLCSLSPVLRSFFQLNPPMDLRSGYGQSKEDPSGSVQQFGDRLSTCQSRIHPFSPLVHCLRTFYGSDGVIRTVTAHQIVVQSIITGSSISSGSAATVRSLQLKFVRIQHEGNTAKSPSSALRKSVTLSAPNTNVSQK